MANQKVSELTAATSWGVSDLLYIVVGGTQDRKITVANLFAAIPTSLGVTDATSASLIVTSGTRVLTMSSTAAGSTQITATAGDLYLRTLSAGKNIYFTVAGTLALTLDTALLATFAGGITSALLSPSQFVKTNGSNVLTSANIAAADLPAATSAAQGAIELATSTEALAGSDTTRAITPSTLDAVLDTRSPNRNCIVNGRMNVWQRGTSFAAIPDSTYAADRFIYYKAVTGAVATVSRDTDVPTSTQAGYQTNYSLKVDVTTADASVGAGDYNLISQLIEGYNICPLVGQNVTLSFWVKSVKTGTYCVALVNSGADRSYVAEYTISAASTWEKKTITIPFTYSGGTWDYTNGVGIRLHFTLMAGSTYQTTAGAWQTGTYLATSNQVNFNDSTSNNFWLTDVQLELGSLATPIEAIPISIELNQCQRYYEKSYDMDVFPGATSDTGCEQRCSINASEFFDSTIRFRASKRGTPIVSIYSTNSGAVAHFYNLNTALDADADAVNMAHHAFNVRSGDSEMGTDHMLRFHWVAEAEMT